MRPCDPRKDGRMLASFILSFLLSVCTGIEHSSDEDVMLDVQSHHQSQVHIQAQSGISLNLVRRQKVKKGDEQPPAMDVDRDVHAESHAPKEPLMPLDTFSQYWPEGHNGAEQ